MPGGDASKGAVPNRNLATVMFTVPPAVDLDAEAAFAAYGSMLTYAATLPAAEVELPGYRVLWCRRGACAHLDLSRNGYAVLGRHSACDIALTDAPELSLRHLLLAPIAIEGGAENVGLRVLDLRASLPFYLGVGGRGEGAGLDVPRRSIFAAGPVFFRLGTYLVGAIPIRAGELRPVLPEVPPFVEVQAAPPVAAGPKRAPSEPVSVRSPSSRTGPASRSGLANEAANRATSSSMEISTMAADEDAWDPPVDVPLLRGSGEESSASGETPSPDEAPFQHLGLRSPAAPSPQTPVPLAVLGSSFDSRMSSRVTEVPRSALLSEMTRPAAPDPSGAGTARLTLLRDGHAASIDLPAADLDAGVLIGRSERCTDGGLRRVLDGNISRVHVILLRDGDDVSAFDLCSTQGTYADGRGVRRYKLSSAGACISLAKVNPVLLCFHPRSAGSSAPSGLLDPAER